MKEYSKRPEVRERLRVQQRLRMREYRKDPTKRSRWNAMYRRKGQEHKLDVFKHYGNKCNCCGETELLFLSMDHVNNDGNIFRKKIHSGYKTYIWIRRNNYPKDLQLLCMNCNFGKARNGGVCPHKNKKESIG